MLLKSDFKLVAKAWASFVVQTLEGTFCSSEIPLVRVHTIAAILDGSPINIGELIANNIDDFATGNKKVIPHLILINWLWEEAECGLYMNDLDAPMMKPITDKYMEVFMKDYVERLQQLAAEEAASASTISSARTASGSAAVCARRGEQSARCLCTYSSHVVGLHVWTLQVDE